MGGSRRAPGGSAPTGRTPSCNPSDLRSTDVGAMRRTTNGANPSLARYRFASRDVVTALATTCSTPRCSARCTHALSKARPMPRRRNALSTTKWLICSAGKRTIAPISSSKTRTKPTRAPVNSSMATRNRRSPQVTHLGQALVGIGGPSAKCAGREFGLAEAHELRDICKLGGPYSDVATRHSCAPCGVGTTYVWICDFRLLWL